MSNPQNPVALITGSGRPRVGNVIARHLADRGYSIALHYNSSEEDAIKSRDEIRVIGCECEAFQADVASESEVDEMAAGVKRKFGRLDVLVTTSSIWGETTFDDVTKEQLHLNFDVNTLGTFFAARAAGRIMIEQPEGGAIVTVGDWSIDRPYLDHVAYFISKGALPTLTRLLARELGERNPKVRVNCIHPGPVMFPGDASEERKARLIEATIVKSADCPEMVAQAVEALVNNKFLTGVCLPVDGGRHMYSPGEV
ncbi:SDR family NAD(P)-dependent oxidoreductase [Bythopirellula goksoeyrii]|uniref:Enoyl-[acyl-carrier-protein] reductase [NADPH] FabL n=1 Tax=Bythopirellula goksoeyrii TaxID=1400387 RepID=A0A5B9QJ24_9BACT|nr:SDR family oxidoreductase [Bythopirellula goksoeyrii]QEG37580.1 Enoyl-[acyl-carrier-protein] reductase [NADPH] FabL [Bythopirellula goksoeyrii]